MTPDKDRNDRTLLTSDLQNWAFRRSIYLLPRYPPAQLRVVNERQDPTLWVGEIDHLWIAAVSPELRLL